MQKTHSQIVEETIEFYMEDPSRRALREMECEDYGLSISCQYLAPDGNMCAVGRCLADPGSIPENQQSDSADELIGRYGNEIFKPEYQGHEVAMWEDLQSWHDSSLNWRDGKPTDEGLAAAAALRIKWDEK